MSSSAKRKVTLFDLDHTLLPIDSDYSWGVYTTQIGWTDPNAFNRRNEEFFAQYKAGALDIAEYVRFATEAVRVRGREAALAARECFMREVIEPALLAPARELVARHQNAGDAVVIVTATNEFVTRPIAEAFGVTDLIAVELELDDAPDGSRWITGAIRGIPSAREGKVARVHQWLEARGLGWPEVESTFYSDSLNDLTLLERVDHPVATNPDDRLRALAHSRGWPVLDLFPKL